MEQVALSGGWDVSESLAVRCGLLDNAAAAGPATNPNSVKACELSQPLPRPNRRLARLDIPP